MTKAFVYKKAISTASALALTTPPTTPPTSTPPSTTGGTPIYPGGPKVNTGGIAIPSPTGEGNMSLLTMMALLASILAIGYGVVRGVVSRISVVSRLSSRDEH